MSAARSPESAKRTSLLEPPSVRASEQELEEVEQVALLIQGTERPATLVGPDGARVPLPDSVYQVLREAVNLLRRGESVSLVVTNEQLTTQQAADLLNVSRPYLIRLLEKQEIPFHKTGTHRRILRSDLLEYRARRDQARRDGLRQMVHDAEALGLYDVPEVPVESLARDE